jgi:hypothetical protein
MDVLGVRSHLKPKLDRLFGKRRGVAYRLQVIAPPDFHVQAEVDGRAEIEVFNALRNAITVIRRPRSRTALGPLCATPSRVIASLHI